MLNYVSYVALRLRLQPNRLPRINFKLIHHPLSDLLHECFTVEWRYFSRRHMATLKYLSSIKDVESIIGTLFDVLALPGNLEWHALSAFCRHFLKEFYSKLQNFTSLFQPGVCEQQNKSSPGLGDFAFLLILI